MDLPKISLREVLKHSRQVEYVDVEGVFSLRIRPFTAAQFEEAKPLVVKIMREFKSMPKDAQLIDGIISLLEKDEYYRDILHVVYLAIERGNDNIEIITEGKCEKFALFTEEEMTNELSNTVIIDIIRMLYRQNVEKNLSGGSEMKPPSMIQEKMAVAIMVPRQEDQT